MSVLFEPQKIGNLELKNRLVRSATAECMANDGFVTDQMIDLYRRLARGGVGLMVTGLTYVHKRGRSIPLLTGIDSDDKIPGLSKLTGEVHKLGGKIAVQVYHCGRHGRPQVLGELPIAPSAIEVRHLQVTPQEMAEEDIYEVIDCFAEGARRARLAGFDAIQLHGAHGYLIHQFLSPYTNKRTDGWGGDLDGRMRFLVEIYHRSREVVGDDYPILVKMNADDLVDGGLTIEETVRIAQRLSSLGIDAIEISGGILDFIFKIIRGGIPLDVMTRGKTPEEKEEMKKSMIPLLYEVKFEEAYFLSYAEKIKEVIDVPLILVGGMRSPLIMEKIVEDGNADFISMCRPLIRDPDFPRKIEQGSMLPSNCTSCNRCLAEVRSWNPLRCYYRG